MCLIVWKPYSLVNYEMTKLTNSNTTTTYMQTLERYLHTNKYEYDDHDVER